MKKVICPIIVGIILLSSLNANAGVYSDDLTRCLIEASTPEETIDFVKWMFGSMSLHPAVKSMSSVTKEQLETSNKIMAELIIKFLTEDCKEQAFKAWKYEGETALLSSFRVFGQVAAKELFSNPAVSAGMEGMEKYFDIEKLEETLGIKN